jgi:hypothetical protein
MPSNGFDSTLARSCAPKPTCGSSRSLNERVVVLLQKKKLPFSLAKPLSV